MDSLRAGGLSALLAVSAWLLAAGVAQAAPGDTTKVNTGGDFSARSSISSDGAFITFEQYDSSVNRTDVFVTNRATGATEKVSHAVGGGVANNNSYGPSLSADGRYVVFYSFASNLVAGDTNFAPDIFVYDRQNDTAERVSLSSAGVQADAGGAEAAAISEDGTLVAFSAMAGNLVPGDTNSASDVFVRDLQADTTERISVTPAGAQGNGAASTPSISGNGRFVSFSANSSDLVAGDTNNMNDVFVRDLQSDTTERVSLGPAGVQGNQDSYVGGEGCCRRSMSSDGRFVIFHSYADNLVAGDTNEDPDVFVRDRQTNQTSRVSLTNGGAQPSGPSYFGSLSTDGRYVIFSSASPDLVANDTNGTLDAFIRDLQSGQTSRISVSSAGAEGNGISMVNSISGDARFVTFESDADNLVGGDTNDGRDVFVRELAGSGFALTVQKSGAGAGTVTSSPAGINCGTDCTESYADGAEVVLTAAASSGSSFSGWSGAGCSGTGACTVTMDQARTVTATFDSAPETSITGNSTATNSGAATYAFTASPPAGATFECSYDDAPFAPCTSPKTSGVLGPGNHTFRVRATNANGTDPTPAVRNFIVDRVAPTVTIAPTGTATTSGKFVGTVTVNADASDPALSSGIRNKFCLIDPPASPTGIGSFGSQPCGGTVSTPGTHTAYAIANDEAGNESAIVSRTFTIVPAPDTSITSGPTGAIWASTPQFAFTSTIPGSTFRCRLDGGAFEPCASPTYTPTLESGAHVFEVAAVSPDGVTDPTPARRDFSVRGTETDTETCRIQPYLALGGNGSADSLCAFDRVCPSTAVHLQGEPCKVLETCPQGARCVLEMSGQWFDADRRVDWTLDLLGQFEIGGNNVTGTAASARCDTGPDGDRCALNATGTALSSSWPQASCSAYPERLSGHEFRADNVRRLECKATMTISPAAPLTTLGFKGSIQTYAPGAGTVTATPGSKTGRVAASPVFSRARPSAFKPVSATAAEAGAVDLKLKLSKPLKKKLKKKGKLKLAVALEFEPAEGGDPITRSTRVTLTKPKKRR